MIIDHCEHSSIVFFARYGIWVRYKDRLRRDLVHACDRVPVLSSIGKDGKVAKHREVTPGRYSITCPSSPCQERCFPVVMSYFHSLAVREYGSERAYT